MPDSSTNTVPVRAAPTTSSGWHAWRIPLALAFLTLSGLASALVSDGWGDAWSWFALGLPVVTMAWHGRRALG